LKVNNSRKYYWLLSVSPWLFLKIVILSVFAVCFLKRKGRDSDSGCPKGGGFKYPKSFENEIPEKPK